MAVPSAGPGRACPGLQALAPEVHPLRSRPGVSKRGPRPHTGSAGSAAAHGLRSRPRGTKRRPGDPAAPSARRRTPVRSRLQTLPLAAFGSDRRLARPRRRSCGGRRRARPRRQASERQDPAKRHGAGTCKSRGLSRVKPWPVPRLWVPTTVAVRRIASLHCRVRASWRGSGRSSHRPTGLVGRRPGPRWRCPSTSGCTRVGRRSRWSSRRHCGVRFARVPVS